MNVRQPQKATKQMSEIGFGAWQLGNADSFGEMDDAFAIALVQEAVKQGVSVFDTAPGYGSGNSERLLGIALKDIRDKVFINTKFGHTVDNRADFTVLGLHKSIEGSLSRLQTDYLDSVILHNPGRELLYGDQDIYQELKALKEQGTIRHFGVSIDSLEELDIVLHHNHVDVIELMFNIIHQSPKALFDEVERQGIILLIKVPLDSGWLTGKYTKETTFTGIRSRWTEEVIDTRLQIVSKIKDISQEENLVPVALQFILSFPAVTSVIPGVRSIGQLLSNVQANDYQLEAETVHKLEILYDTYIKNQHTPW